MRRMLFCTLLFVASGVSSQPQAESGRPPVEEPLLQPVPAAPEVVASFDAALRLLRANNSDLKLQAERVRQAEAARRQALAQLLPSLSGAALAQQNLLDPGNNFIVSGPASTGVVGGGGGPATGGAGGPRPTYVLGLGSLSGELALVDARAWNGIATAKNAFSAETHGFENVQRTLIGQLADNLVGVAALERLSELERVSLRNALERLYIVRRSEEVGASNRLDVIRLEQDVAVSRDAVVQADEALRKGRESLGLLLGKDGAVGIAAQFNLAGLAENVRSLCRPLDSVEARADVLTQRSLVAVALGGLRDATVQYLPRLSLSSDVFAFTTDPGFAHVPSWNIAAILEFTIWDGGAREANHGRAKSALREAEERATFAERSARVEVTRARRAIEVSRERLEQARRARDLALENDQLTLRSFQFGKASSLDLIATSTALRRAELNLALREFDLTNSVVGGLVSLADCRW